MDTPVLFADPERSVIVGEAPVVATPLSVVSARAATAEGDAPEESGHAAVWHDRDRPGTAPRGGGLAFVGLAAPGAEGVVAGVNARGIHALGDPGEGATDAEAAEEVGRMTRRILEQAADPAVAAALAAAELREARLAGAAIHLAGPGRATSLHLSGRDVRVDDVTGSALPLESGAWPEAALTRLAAAAADAPRRPSAALLARLRPVPEILICLGPPQCGVAIRYWPGIDVAPPVAELGDLAARLAGVVHVRPELQTEVDHRLGAVRAAVLAEGDQAERLAAIMDRDGDDRGAEVRRGVAQFHALELARDALRELLDGLDQVSGAAGPASRADL